MEITPEEIILNELGSPKKSVKIAAIVKAAKLSCDPKILIFLQELAASSDKETALFARNAVSRLQLKQAQKEKEVPSLTGEISVERLLKPRPDDIPGLLKKIREEPSTIPEEFRHPTAEFLSKHGVAADCDILMTWMSEYSGNLVVPFLETIASLDSSKVPAIIPAYLASPHPYVRSRAIGILNKIDPEEAAAHLSELLASDNSEERLTGLQIAFLFPFNEISSLVITLLTEEKEAEVIQAAAVFLLSNPEIETAYRLLVLRENLAEPQVGLINKLLSALCRTMVAVGMLEENAAAPEILLKKLRHERLEKYLANLEIQISLGDSTRLPGIEVWLDKNRNDPRVAAFIEKLVTNPTTEEFARRLMRPLANEAATATSSADIREASPEEKCAFLKAPHDEISTEIAAWIRHEAAQGPDRVRAAALKAMVTLAPEEEDATIAELNLEHPNPIVATRAISLLQKIDSRRLGNRLPNLLRSDDPFISARAVQLSLSYYENEAIGTVSGMLRSPYPATRAQAINSLMLCPFEKVATFIFEAIPRETNLDIAKGLLFILLNNPTFETLKALDNLPKSLEKSVDLLVAQARSNLFKLLLHLDMLPEQSQPEAAPAPADAPSAVLPPTPISEPQKTAKLPHDVEETPSVTPTASPTATQTRIKDEKPASVTETKSLLSHEKTYSVAGIRNAIWKREILEKNKADKRKKQTKSRLQLFLESLWLSPFKFGFAVVLICGLGYYIFFSAPVQVSDIPTNSDAQEGIHEVSTTFKMNVLCSLKGKVVSVEPDNTVKFKIGDRVFILEFQGKPPIIIGNEEAQVDIVPYLHNENGEIYAQCYAFK